MRCLKRFLPHGLICALLMANYSQYSWWRRAVLSLAHRNYARGLRLPLDSAESPAKRAVSTIDAHLQDHLNSNTYIQPQVQPQVAPRLDDTLRHDALGIISRLVLVICCALRRSLGLRPHCTYLTGWISAGRIAALGLLKYLRYWPDYPISLSAVHNVSRRGILGALHRLSFGTWHLSDASISHCASVLWCISR